MSTKFRLAPGFEHHFRIVLGACGGGPLWSGDRSAPRASFLLWRDHRGLWHAFVGGSHALTPMREVATGATRQAAFDNACK